MKLRVGPKVTERVLEVKLRERNDKEVDIVLVGPGGTEQAIARVEVGDDLCRLVLLHLARGPALILGIDTGSNDAISTIME